MQNSQNPNFTDFFVLPPNSFHITPWLFINFPTLQLVSTCVRAHTIHTEREREREGGGVCVHMRMHPFDSRLGGSWSRPGQHG
jgi:hypothetical protein